MRYFTLSEFDSPDEPGSGNRMDPHFLEILDRIREEAGFPFFINSGYRTRKHNMSLSNSTPNSAHTRGMAADIRAGSGQHKYLIVAAALLNGIRRIGIGSNFIHIDIDSTLPNPTVWTY